MGIQENVINGILSSFAAKTSKKEYCDALIDILSNLTHCSCLGIRVATKDGYIPYVSYRGFSDDFLKEENWVSINTNNCTCVRVIKGTFVDADKKFIITTGGSSIIFDRVLVEKKITKNDLNQFRGKCLGENFSTIVLIPIKYRDQIIGAIHLADKKANALTYDVIIAIEAITPIIGEALFKYELDANLKLSANLLHNFIPELFKKKETKEEYLGLIVEFVKKCSGVKYVGVRMLTDKGLLPFVAYNGYNDKFYQTESEISIYNEDCICSRIFREIPENDDLPFMTSGGSYYLSDIDLFISKLSPFQLTRFRGRCIEEGFKTLAAIPIRQNGIKIGAIHLADDKPHAVEREVIEYFEMIAPLIGEALEKYKMEEEKALIEKEMERLGRLSLVGEMASNIGHEIRNPLTVVKGFLQMMSKRAQMGKEKEYFSMIIEELDLVNAIITEYLSLSKSKRTNKEFTQLNNLIERLIPLMEDDCKKNNITINLELGETPEILIDNSEIEKLLMNLTRNSIEAMKAGGIITIRTIPELEAVLLEIEDQGRGIPEEVLEKIGIPFVTTKDTSVGLGLAICYSIAARHNATIQFDSDSKGTVFRVRFSTK